MIRQLVKGKKLALLIMIILLIFTPAGSGCWDRREPDAIAIVIMLAFDRDPQAGLFHVIAQVTNPLGAQQGNGGNGGGGEERGPILLAEARGATVYEAIQNLELITSRNLLFTHLSTILFSERLAREGLRPVLDYLDREQEARLIAHPFVARGNVMQAMKMEFPLEQVGGLAFNKKHRNIMTERSVTPWTDSLRVMMLQLSRRGQELVLPTFEFEGESGGAGGNGEDGGSPGGEDGDEGANSAGEGGSGDREKRLLMAGGALFRGDRLVGYFNEKETAGYMWITGHVSRAIKVIKCPDEEDIHVTIEIFEGATELVPVIDGDEVRFRLSILAEGRIQDFGCPHFPLKEEFIDSLNRRLATVIRNEVEMSLAKAQELETDVFGLGNLLYRTEPEQWRRLEAQWHEIFPEVVVDMEIEAIIRRAGLVLEPIQIR